MTERSYPDACASVKNAIEKIKSVDLNTMTPIEAMNLLFELKKSVTD